MRAATLICFIGVMVAVYHEVAMTLIVGGLLQLLTSTGFTP
jgi:hypothetical protein